MNEQTIDRVKRRKRSKGRRRLSGGAHIIRRRMGKAGVRCILVRPGKPARIVKCR
jgi:hypothetical protein